MKPNQPLVSTVACRLSQQEKKGLQQLSLFKGLTVSEYLRIIVKKQIYINQKYLSSHEKN
jgi:predicted DNA-binding protein